jgi:hypothetical protein
MRTNPNGLVQKGEPALVPDGNYPARLVEVFPFANAHGERMGFRFEIDGGLYAGVTVMASAARRESPMGRLAEILRELLGREPTAEELRGGIDQGETIDAGCRIVTREERNRAGLRYSAVVKVMRT